MHGKENLTKKFILVKMRDIQISTDEKPIIGTQSLATCVGVLIYSEESKKAIVAHIANERDGIAKEAFDKIKKMVIDNDLYIHLKPLKYVIIPGPFPTDKTVERDLKNSFATFKGLFVPFDEKENIKDAIQEDKETGSLQFAFDSSTGEFVTKKVYFGKQYIQINKNTNHKEQKSK